MAVLLSLLYRKKIYYCSRYWSQRNPRWYVARKNLKTKKVMAWVGIINEQIIGPYFFRNNVTAEAYEEMINDYLIPELDRRGIDTNEVVYMHDGAPAHYTDDVQRLLNDNFQGFIGRGDLALVKWPARSPDLNPLDFFLWSFVKHIIFKHPARNLNHLKHKIEEALDNITVEMLRNVQNNINKRYQKCIELNGGIMEPHMR